MLSYIAVRMQHDATLCDFPAKLLSDSCSITLHARHVLYVASVLTLC